MTETRATSGAAGASTRAGDPPVPGPAEQGPGWPATATEAAVRDSSLGPYAPVTEEAPTRRVPAAAPDGGAGPDGAAALPQLPVTLTPIAGVSTPTRAKAATLTMPAADTTTQPDGSQPSEPAAAPKREEPTARVTGAVSAIGAKGRAKVSSLLKSVPGRRSVVVAPEPEPGVRVTGRASAVGSARVAAEAMRVGRTVTSAASRGPRRARLHLKRIDPWSVMKFSCAVSVVLAVVLVVATSVLYLALDAMGVFDSVNTALAELTGNIENPEQAFRLTSKGIIGTSILLGVVNTVLFTALMTLGAFIYNVCADLVGGIEITLSEKE